VHGAHMLVPTHDPCQAQRVPEVSRGHPATGGIHAADFVDHPGPRRFRGLIPRRVGGSPPPTPTRRLCLRFCREVPSVSTPRQMQNDVRPRKKDSVLHAAVGGVPPLLQRVSILLVFSWAHSGLPKKMRVEAPAAVGGVPPLLQQAIRLHLFWDPPSFCICFPAKPEKLCVLGVGWGVAGRGLTERRCLMILRCYRWWWVVVRVCGRWCPVALFPSHRVAWSAARLLGCLGFAFGISSLFRR